MLGRAGCSGDGGSPLLRNGVKESAKAKGPRERIVEIGPRAKTGKTIGQRGRRR